jgi:hypothetical protein
VAGVQPAIACDGASLGAWDAGSDAAADGATVAVVGAGVAAPPEQAAAMIATRPRAMTPVVVRMG